MLNMFRMGPSPHIRTSETVDKVMYDVIISLIPALLMAVYIFGTRAITMTAFSVAVSEAPSSSFKSTRISARLDGGKNCCGTSLNMRIDSINNPTVLMITVLR